MECKSGCHERKNLHQFNGHLQHWTEAETKSDSQVESLINVAEVKTNFLGRWEVTLLLNSGLTTTIISLRSTYT